MRQKLKPKPKKVTSYRDELHPHKITDLLTTTIAQNPPRHPLSQKFHDLLKEIGELHDKKQKDYGIKEDPFFNVRASEDFGIPGWIGAANRGNDKMRRIQKSATGEKLENESIRDSFMDLAVYSLIALILYEEEYGNEN